MDVADAENSVDRMFAGLGRPKRDGEDKYALFNACPHHLLFEGDAVVLRRKLDDAIVVRLENTVAVANAQLDRKSVV